MKKLITLFLLIFCFITEAELNLELPNLGVPSLGGNNHSFITSSKERKKGVKILRQLRATNLIIEDPEINIWIRSLGNKLTSYAPNSSNPYYFLVSKDISVNAFATEGGVIVINAGLILNTSTESELAAVISHEIAHITQQHLARMIQKNKNNRLMTNVALLAGLIATKEDSQAGQAIVNTAVATIIHQQLSFGRKAETEADRVGIRILARAGFDPQGMPDFLGKLSQNSNDKTAQIIEYLQNHPLPLKRVADTSFLAKQLGKRKRKDQSSYRFMREKVRLLSKANTLPSQNIPSTIKKYAKALKLLSYRKYGHALKAISTKSQNISVAILRAQLFNKQHMYHKTLQLLTPLINIYPDDIALVIPLSQAHTGLGNRSFAWEILNSVNISEQTSLEFFDALQHASYQHRKTSAAYQAAANRNVRTGHYQSARIQLNKALKTRGTSPVELRKIERQLLSF